MCIMDSIEIDRVMKKNIKTKKYFCGVFPCDKLPKYISKKPACFIINTDPSYMPGSHWVCVYFTLRGNADYFDSFGLKPRIKSILKFILRNSVRYTYNKRSLQNILSNVCGKYCCEYLLNRCQNRSYNFFMKSYINKTIHNDETTLKNFKKHFMIRRVRKNKNKILTKT